MSLCVSQVIVNILLLKEISMNSTIKWKKVGVSNECEKKIRANQKQRRDGLKSKFVEDLVGYFGNAGAVCRSGEVGKALVGKAGVDFLHEETGQTIKVFVDHARRGQINVGSKDDLSGYDWVTVVSQSLNNNLGLVIKGVGGCEVHSLVNSQEVARKQGGKEVNELEDFLSVAALKPINLQRRLCA